MIIEKYITQYNKTYNVRVCPKSPRVDIFQIVDMEGNWKKPVINWPGCGDRNEIETSSFISVLEKAKEICRALEAGVNFEA